MLEGLDLIDWSSIHHSHGPATNFPQWIRDFASDDENIRRIAFERISELSAHQFNVYEVTSYVVPFLIELLQYENIQDKSNILALLGTHSAIRPLYAGHQESLTHYKKTQENLQKGVSKYLSLLQDNDPAVRVLASDLYSRYEIFPASADNLLSHLKVETDNWAKSEIVMDVGELIERNASQLGYRIEVLESFIDSNEYIGVRFCAAKSLSIIKKNEMSEETIAALSATLIEPQVIDLACCLPEFIVHIACDALCYLPVKKTIAVLMQVLPLVPYPNEIHIIAIRLLDLAFFGKGREMSYGSIPDVLEGYVNKTLFRQDDPEIQRIELEDNQEAIFRIDAPYQSQDDFRSDVYVYESKQMIERPLQLTNIQKSALETVLNTDMVWMRHSNLLELYGFLPSRHKTRQLLMNLSNSISEL